MIVLMQREAKPDAVVWPGRRILGAIDAVGWPTAWVVILLQVPGASPQNAPIVAGAAVIALMRLRVAVFANHRYWFTTWRWARVAALLVLVGAILKLALPA